MVWVVEVPEPAIKVGFSVDGKSTEVEAYSREQVVKAINTALETAAFAVLEDCWPSDKEPYHKQYNDGLRAKAKQIRDMKVT